MTTLFGKRAFLALMISMGAFTTGACGSDSGTELPPGSPICGTCTVKADCTGANSECLHNDKTGEQFCGSDCSKTGCPNGFECVTIPNGTNPRQCVPSAGTCANAGASGGSSSGGASGGSSSGGASGGSSSGGASGVGTGNPNFLGPFCEGKPRHVIGITTTPASADATNAEMRQYMLDAVNTIRAMTNLPALKMDDCLNKIADAAIADAATGGVHGYFKNNCMNAAHNFGKSCECNWAQENYGAAGGSSYTWKDTLNVPVCGMMDEPKGVGHRGNIENKEWTRLGVGIIKKGAGSTQWVHEFGR